MFYKPTYCCDCGDKIDRIEWKLLESRRYCELCETEHQIDEWVPRLLGGLLALFGIWGVGSYLTSSQLYSNPDRELKFLSQHVFDSSLRPEKRNSIKIESGTRNGKSSDQTSFDNSDSTSFNQSSPDKNVIIFFF